MQSKNQEEIMQMIEGIIKEKECALTCQHMRVLQGGIEMDLFVVSSVALPQANHEPLPAASNPLLAAQSEESRRPELVEGRQTIEQAIIEIFRYQDFSKDHIMAKSALHNLRIVQQAQQAFLRQQEQARSTLSKHQKANMLREFLTNWLDKEFCPTPGNCPPKNLLELPFVPKNKWIEYLILRWQYVDGHSCQQVLTELQRKDCNIAGGTYRRHLKAARKRLAEQLWQKEREVIQAYL